MKDDVKDIKSIKDIKNIFANIFPIFFKNKKRIGYISLVCYRYEKIYKKIKFDRCMKIRGVLYPIKFFLGRGIRIGIGKYHYYFNIAKVSIPSEDLKTLPPQNLCIIRFIKDDLMLKFPVVYNAIYYNKYIGKTGPVYKYSTGDLVCYFRQTRMNSIAITVRENNVTDQKIMTLKVFLAKLVSFIYPKNNIILLYEKESNKYEESARTVYERLIDLGYKNAYL